MVLFQIQETGISVSIYLIKLKSLLSSKHGKLKQIQSKTKQVQKQNTSRTKTGLLKQKKNKRYKETT